MKVLLAIVLAVPSVVYAQDTRRIAAALRADPPASAAWFQPAPHRQTDADRVRDQADRDRLAAVEHARVDLAEWIFGATAGADWAVTAVCYKVDCSDRAGHSAGYFLGRGFDNAGVATALGLGVDAGIAILAHEVIAPDHPKLAQAILWAAAGVRVVILTNKIGDLRDHARRID